MLTDTYQVSRGASFSDPMSSLLPSFRSGSSGFLGSARNASSASAAPERRREGRMPARGPAGVASSIWWGTAGGPFSADNDSLLDDRGRRGHVDPLDGGL